MPQCEPVLSQPQTKHPTAHAAPQRQLGQLDAHHQLRNMGANAPMDMGKWKGLFEWSMKYQEQGADSSAVQQLTPERQKWLEQALSDFMKDFAERMKEITAALVSSDAAGDASGEPTSASPGATLAEKEALCDELMEIVEHVDYARDLHKIGGLPTLLALMGDAAPSLRWRAAEIAATCMANNPPVQRWFMDGGALPRLMALLADAHDVVVTKALLALSALVRHYGPGLEAFRLAGGLQSLLGLLGCATDAQVASAAAAAADAAASSAQQQQQQRQEVGSPEQQQEQAAAARRRRTRKVLALLQYVLQKHPADCLAAARFGVAPRLCTLLGAPDADSDMRQAALQVLLSLLRQPGSWQAVASGEAGLQAQLAALLAAHQALPADDADAEAEEGVLLRDALAALQAPPAPAPGLCDHIEVDQELDGGEQREQTLSIREPAAAPQAASAAAGAGGGGGGLALVPVPKPELR